MSSAKRHITVPNRLVRSSFRKSMAPANQYPAYWLVNLVYAGEVKMKAPAKVAGYVCKTHPALHLQVASGEGLAISKLTLALAGLGQAKHICRCLMALQLSISLSTRHWSTRLAAITCTDFWRHRSQSYRLSLAINTSIVVIIASGSGTKTKLRLLCLVVTVGGTC